MSALTEFFFPLPAVRRTPIGILNWWESRRLAYNLTVGAAGLFSLVTVTLFGVLPPHPVHAFVPWQAIVAYGIMANVCYTAGPLVEILTLRLWKDDVLPVGPTLFRHGLIFSVGLSLLPTLLGGMLWVARVAQSFVR